MKVTGITIGALLIATFTAACGGGGGGGSGAKSLSLDAAVGYEGSGVWTVTASASGGTRPHAFKLADPSEPVLYLGTAGSSGDMSVRAPMLGVYQVTVVVTDAKGRERRQILDLTTSESSGFGIHGSVEVGSIGSAGQAVDLAWKVNGDVTVASTTSDDSGAFSFGDLLGDAAEFFVVSP